jgi:hypothetical protein
LALGFQDRGGLLDIVGRRGGGIGVGFDASDGFRDVLGALSGVLRAAGDFLGGAPCSWTAAAIAVATSLTSPMMLPIPLMASMASPATF